MKVIALAGKSGSGKTTLARELQRILRDAEVVSTSALLRERAGAGATNEELFAKGKQLDEDEPKWFIKQALRSEREWLIVDAVRSLHQFQILRKLRNSGSSAIMSVRLVFVGEPDPAHGLPDPYDHQSLLAKVHDPAGQALEVLEANTFIRPAIGVVGAQWGSEGKGKVCAWLTQTRGSYQFSAAARAGGPNAGHRIELPDGSFKVFRHLPSATPYLPWGTKACIGPGAVVDLAVLASELEYLPAGVELVVDPRAAIVDEAAREMEKTFALNSIGSTMTGSGGAQALRVLRAAPTFADLKERRLPAGATADDYARVLARVSIRPVGRELREASCRGPVIFEATQGMGLSLLSGPYPHTTSRDVSPVGILGELGLPPTFPVDWWLVARSYPIRVGGPSGPMGDTECTWEDVAKTAGKTAEELMGKERTSVTNRLRRVARWQRGSLIRVARQGFHGSAEKPSIFISFADYLTQAPEQLAEIVNEAKHAGMQVWLGTGPRNRDVERVN